MQKLHIIESREEATLDLSATRMTEFSGRVVMVGSEKMEGYSIFGGHWFSTDWSGTERLSMAKKDRTGNRKTREQRKQFKVPELGCLSED